MQPIIIIIIIFAFKTIFSSQTDKISHKHHERAVSVRTESTKTTEPLILQSSVVALLNITVGL